MQLRCRGALSFQPVDPGGAVPLRRTPSCRRWPAPSRRGSVDKCRARLCEIKGLSGQGLQWRAGQVGNKSSLQRRAGAAIKVGEVAPLRRREHSVWQLRWAPFGTARSCALCAFVVVPRSGGSFDEVNAGESNFALERTASKRGTLSDGSPRRRSARALDRLIHLAQATAATTW